MRKHPKKKPRKKLKYYNGQRGLRGQNTDETHPDVMLTEDRLRLMMSYEDDIIRWAQNECYIVNGDLGRVRIKLRDYQIEILEKYQQYQKILLNTSRQAGKSLMLALIIVHFILYNPDKIVGVVSYNKRATKEVLRKAKDIYSKLPLWMQSPVEVWNTERIELSNGAIVLTDIPKPDTLRGETISLLVLDEMDHYTIDEWNDLIKSAFPTLSSVKSHKGVFSSTPKGFKQMYKMMMDIKSGKLKNHAYIEVPYTKLPHADDEWVEQVKSEIPDEVNRDLIFEQEYNNKFILLNNSIFSTKLISKQKLADPIMETNDSVIFHKPIMGHRYSIGVDLSDGVGGDFAVIYVLDITSKPFKTAKIWRKNTFTYDYLANKVYEISTEYNNALTIIEDNNMGKIFIDNMTKLSFQNMVSFDGKKFGFNTNKGSKLRIIDNLNTYMLNEWIEILYLNAINELSTYIKHPNGSYGAMKGKYDDIAMALMLALSITLHPNYTDYIESLSVGNMVINLMSEQDKMNEILKRQIIIFGGCEHD